MFLCQDLTIIYRHIRYNKQAALRKKEEEVVEYEIYIDVIFVINFIMDLFILHFVGKLMKYKCNMIRECLASGVGALGVCVDLLVIRQESYIIHLILYGVLSFLMIYLSFHPKNIRSFLTGAGCLYLVTFLLGGIVSWIFYSSRLGYYIQLITHNKQIANMGTKNFLIIFIASFLLFKLLFRNLISFRKKSKTHFQIEVELMEGSVKTVGLMDTGNSLIDPITKMPVSIGEYQLFKHALSPEYQIAIEAYIKNQDMDQVHSLTNLHFIPYQSIGKSHGMLIGVISNKIHIKTEKDTVTKEKIMLAFSKEQLSNRHEYFVILHPDIMNK